MIGSTLPPEPPKEIKKPAEPKPEDKIDVAAELAWAKQRFAKELGTFDMTSHAPDLVAWVAPKSKIAVVVTSELGRCKPGELRRGEDDELTLVIYHDERTVGKDRVRKYNEGNVGDEMDLGGSGGTEKKQKDGTWSQDERWGASDQGSWGHLSSVTKDVARFAGTWVDVAASCKGAVTKLQCKDPTETISCNACTGVELSVTDRPMGMMGRSYAAVPLSIGCPSCPEVSNPDLDRMRALVPELNGWTVANEAKAPAIYRRSSDCK